MKLFTSCRCNSLLILIALGSSLFITAQTNMELISVSSRALTSASPNGNSGGPVLSPDGRFVLFSSDAANLVTNRGITSFVDIYLHDRSTRKTSLVSVNAAGTGGAGASSISYDLSDDGRFAVFQSLAANLAGTDQNGESDIFLRDLIQNKTVLVSHQPGNLISGNRRSENPVISADGRFAAYQSVASNLASTDDRNELGDIFLYDRETGLNQWISKGSSPTLAHSENPVISADGRFIAFTGSLTNLVTARALAVGYREIFVYDRVAQRLSWPSEKVLGLANALFAVTDMDCFGPAFSGDGKFLLFQAWSGRTPGVIFTLQYDLQTTNLTVLHQVVGAAAIQPVWDARTHASTDGRYVLHALGTNLFRWDGQQKTNLLVNLNVGGTQPAAGVFLAERMSADGRYVSFLSDATNLVARPSAAGSFQIYLRDLTLGTTSLVSTNSAGNVTWNMFLSYPEMSADGGLLVFESDSPTLVPNDLNGLLDVFAHSTATGSFELVSRSDKDVVLETSSSFSSVGPDALSADGRFLVFTSLATNLTDHVTLSIGNVFVRDLLNRKTTLVSEALDGIHTGNGNSFEARISANGRFVVFTSNATNLVSLVDNNAVEDVFVRDLELKKTFLVSVNRSGARTGAQASDMASISADGQSIVFQSGATDLVFETKVNTSSTLKLNVFWRDLKANETRMLSVATTGGQSGNNDSFGPIISSNGRWVSFWSLALDLATNGIVNGASPRLHVKDLVTGSIFRILALVGSIRYIPDPIPFSPSDRFLVHPLGGFTANSLNIFDVISQSDKPVCTNCVTGNASADGRFVVYETLRSTRDPNTQIYLKDLLTDRTTLISSPDGTTPANGNSLNATISANGRFILFESKATNLSADTNAFTDVYLFDRVRGRLQLVSGPRDGLDSGNSVSANPSLNLVRGIVAFESFSDSLVPNDHNGFSDVFVWRLPLDQFDPSRDADADGLEDAWELKFFGKLDQNAWDDPDLDALSNLDEQQARTDPAQANGDLRVTGIVNSNSSVRLIWGSVSGTKYQVQYRDDIVRGNWVSLPAIITATSNSTETSVSPAQARTRFYRVVHVE